MLDIVVYHSVKQTLINSLAKVMSDKHLGVEDTLGKQGRHSKGNVALSALIILNPSKVKTKGSGHGGRPQGSTDCLKPLREIRLCGKHKCSMCGKADPRHDRGNYPKNNFGNTHYIKTK